MTIVRLGQADVERFREIRLRSLLDSPEAFGSTHDEVAARPLESWVGQLEALPTFVAVHDDRDVGLVRGAPYEGREGAAILLSMWVASEARGKGLGEALIRAVVDWARGAHFRRLFLDVGNDNAPAIALYARMGFEPTGEVGSLPAPRDHVLEHERCLELGSDAG